MISYTQTFPNSCGAVSLMCAAIELGMQEIPVSDIHPLWVMGNSLGAKGNKGSEIKIYAVTSGIPGQPDGTTGYSLPSNIGKAAKALGLTTIAFVPESITGKFLLLLYKTEKIDAQNAGMLLKRATAPAPEGNQRLLKILRVGDATSWLPARGLHYVMQRPDMTIMDPALGQNFPDMETAIAAHRAAGSFYEDTGLSILIAG